jgi:hypothetical protein
MRIDATSVEDYLARAPHEHRHALALVRDLIRSRLPPGYQEGLQYGMISWFVPLSRYPKTYNGQPLIIASLASQRRYMALYLMSVYGDEALRSWFINAYAASGKKLDMGKSCVRFASLDALPLDVVGEVVSRVSVDAYVAFCERAQGSRARTSAAKVEPAARVKARPRSAAKVKANPAAKVKANPAAKVKANPAATVKAKPAAKAKAKPKVKPAATR